MTRGSGRCFAPRPNTLGRCFAARRSRCSVTEEVNTYTIIANNDFLLLYTYIYIEERRYTIVTEASDTPT